MTLMSQVRSRVMMFEYIYIVTLVVVLSAGGYSFYEYLKKTAVETAVEAAVEAAIHNTRVATLTFEIQIVSSEQSADKGSDRADVDRIVRGIARMRHLVNLQFQAHSLSQENFVEANGLIQREAEYLAPYIYKYGELQMFYVFGDNLRYSGLSPSSAGLGDDYWVALSKAK